MGGGYDWKVVVRYRAGEKGGGSEREGIERELYSEVKMEFVYSYV